jgi:hypothetical protein
VAGLSKIESILLISFLSLLIFPLLYLCRSLDNNTLASWQWVFIGAKLNTIILLLILAVVVSFFLSCKITIEKRPLFSLLFLTCLAVVPLWQEPELLLDSGRYFLQAKHLSQYGFISFWNEWGKSITAWTDLPLVPLLYGFVFKLFGESRVAIQLFNTLIFALTILLTYLTGKILLNKESGFYAALLLLGLPYLLSQVPLMLVDTHAMFFMILALYTFLKAIEEEKGWLLLSSITIALAMLVKFSTWPMLILLPLMAAAQPKNRPENFLRRIVIIFLVTSLLIGLFIFSKYKLFLDQMDLLLHFQRPLMTAWQEHPASRFLFQTHPFVTILACWALFKSSQKGNHRILIMGVFLLVFFIQVGRIRYLIPLMPFFTLVAAYGLSSFRYKEVRRFVGITIVISSLVITQVVYLPFLNKTSMSNINNAATYIETLPHDALEVHFLTQEKSGGNTASAIPLLDLYISRKIVAKQRWSSAETARQHGKTPLLFTWFQKKPLYYQPPSAETMPLVIISGSPIDDALYAKIRGSQPASVKHFNSRTNVFRFKTFVSVYY